MLRRDASLDSSFQSCLVQAHRSCRHIHRHSASIRKCNKPHTSIANTVWLVVALDFSRGPPDIARLVVPVVIDTVERHSGARYLAHVGEEDRKVVPSLADLNASCSVPLVGMMFRVGAFVSHG